MQVVVTPPFVAVMVTVSPLPPPEAEKVGVLSEVTLSVVDDPVSDDVRRLFDDGAVGGVVSIVTVEP